MTVTGVSMTGLYAFNTGPDFASGSTVEIRWVSKTPKPGERPRNILGTVALNMVQPWQLIPVGGDSSDVEAHSLAGVWIIGYEDEHGYHDFPKGLKWAFVPQCKSMDFVIDVTQQLSATGVGRMDYFD